MGILTDAAASLAGGAAPQVEAWDEPSEFRKGLRSGTLGAGSQVTALGGLASEVAGADGVARTLRDQAREWRDEGAAAGPRVSSYKQVQTLRDALDYGAGIAGSLVPSALPSIAAGGAVALTGGGALPVLGASALASAPMEMGDVVQRQEDDPTAMAKPAGERLRDAVVGGGASAVAQGL